MSIRESKQEKKSAGAVIEIENGLTKQILREGEGEVVPLGHMVSVHYTGTLEDGQQFDSSRSSGPFQFKLGARNVILGWDKAVATMKVGERAIIVCPPDYGYGNSGVGPIPGNATLTFDVEVLGHSEPSAFEFPWAIILAVICLILIIAKPLGYDWTRLLTVRPPQRRTPCPTSDKKPDYTTVGKPVTGCDNLSLQDLLKQWLEITVYTS
eukprot:g4735.t1